MQVVVVAVSGSTNKNLIDDILMSFPHSSAFINECDYNLSCNSKVTFLLSNPSGIRRREWVAASCRLLAIGHSQFAWLTNLALASLSDEHRAGNNDFRMPCAMNLRSNLALDMVCEISEQQTS